LTPLLKFRISDMHTVIETPAYLREARGAGMTEAEMRKAVKTVSENPEAGTPIQGTGGFRKLRLAGRGKGKSGGYRLVTFFSGADIPVFLITVFGKGERADLSQAERNELVKLGKELLETYRAKLPPIGKKRKLLRTRRPR
jgi:hypothetical protein